MSETTDPRHFLPLTPAVFHVLLTLSDGERHGYGIIQDVATATAGDVCLRTGTLYTILKRLLDEDLIRESARREEAPQDDGRRRCYTITPLGRAVVQAEARRLEQMVTLARSRRMLPKTARGGDR